MTSVWPGGGKWRPRYHRADGTEGLVLGILTTYYNYTQENKSKVPSHFVIALKYIKGAFLGAVFIEKKFDTLFWLSYKIFNGRYWQSKAYKVLEVR